MKAVYRSIKPYWLYLVIIGKKMDEVGKTFPKADDWNKDVFLHCSKDMKSFKRIPEKDREWMRKYLGKVACRFVCNRFTFIDAYYDTNGIRHLCNTAFIKSCVPDDELFDYLYGKYGKKHGGWAWHISDIVIYDKPKELSEFFHYCGDNPKCDGCEAHYFSNTECGKEDYCCSIIDGCKPLKRPPQSWCYVEERS